MLGRELCSHIKCLRFTSCVQSGGLLEPFATLLASVDRKGLKMYGLGTMPRRVQSTL